MADSQRFITLVKFPTMPGSHLPTSTDYEELVNGQKGTVIDSYPTNGRYDSIVICEFPDQETAMACWLTAKVKWGITPETLGAGDARKFDSVITQTRQLVGAGVGNSNR